MRTDLRRRLTAACATLVVAVGCLGAAPASAAPAGRAPVQQAPVAPAPGGPADLAAPTLDPAASSEVLREQVATLAAQVDELDVRAEVAAEDWNEVTAELDALIGQEVAAQVALDDAGRALQDDRAAATRRVRALYRTGGTVEIAWTALASTGGGFAQAASGFQTARAVLDADAVVVERAGERVGVAVSTSTAVQDLRRRRADLEDEAQARHRDAEAALAARQALLSASGSVLAGAVERERQEAERLALEQALAAAARAAAERDAQLRLDALAALSPGARAQAAAQDGAGSAGPAGGTVRAEAVGSDLQAVLDRASAGAPTPAAGAAIQAAGSRLGMPYTWGATGPGTFDCSGLTLWAYAQAGVRLPRTSRQQYAGLTKVPVEQMLPGDLLFYADGSDPSSIHHVAIWLGDGLILTAPRTGDVVKISPVWNKPVYGAVRPTA